MIARFRTKAASVLAWTAVFALLIAPTLLADEADVANQINGMSISSSAKSTVSSGFLRGISDGRLTADDALSFLQRVAAGNGTATDVETILTTIATGLLQDLPVDMLTSKVDEGLARGFPMDVIATEVVERKQTLLEVKTMLNTKGIVISDNGYALMAIDASVTDIATVLENHIRSGKSANDGTLLTTTLTTLDRDGRVTDALYQALSNSLTEAELAALATNISNRM
jgi:hypothetical protein